MCEKCNDTGYILDPKSGISKNCECYEELINDRLIKRLTKYQESKMEKTQNISSFIEITPRHTEIKNKIKSFIDKSESMLHNGIGITFYGPIGTGKTHLMNSLLSEIKKIRKCSVYKVTSTDFVSTYINNIKTNDAQNYIELLKTVDVLAIDDIDKKMGKEWIVSQYFDIINYRYDNMLSTFISTNLNYGELIKKMDEVSKTIGEAIVSRLNERNFTLSFERLINYRTTIKKPIL